MKFSKNCSCGCNHLISIMLQYYSYSFFLVLSFIERTIAMHLVLSIIENDIWALLLRGNGEPEVLLSDIVPSLCQIVL